jgi:hypothetical protein
MLNFITLFKIKKFLNRYALDRKPLSLEEGRLNMVIMPSFNVEGTFSEGIFSNERKVV